MAGGRRVYIPKKAGETVTIPFDFLSDLAPTETIATATVTASVYSGVDATPSSIISGSDVISGSEVLQKVTGGVVGVIYGLLCQATTSTGQSLAMSMYIAIEPNLP